MLTISGVMAGKGGNFAEFWVVENLLKILLSRLIFIQKCNMWGCETPIFEI